MVSGYDMRYRIRRAAFCFPLFFSKSHDFSRGRIDFSIFFAFAVVSRVILHSRCHQAPHSISSVSSPFRSPRWPPLLSSALPRLSSPAFPAVLAFSLCSRLLSSPYPDSRPYVCSSSLLLRPWDPEGPVDIYTRRVGKKAIWSKKKLPCGCFWCDAATYPVLRTRFHFYGINPLFLLSCIFEFLFVRFSVLSALSTIS